MGRDRGFPLPDITLYFWCLCRELVECFQKISKDSDCRAVVVSGAGKMFTSGIDLMDMASDLLQPSGDDAARIAWYLRDLISQYQKTFTAIEKVTLRAGWHPLCQPFLCQL